MYEDLIKRLRETSIWFGELDNVSDLLLEAANTIEELDAKYNKALQDLVKLAKNSPKVDNRFGEWIPVTERPPKKNGVYLVYVYGEVTEMNYWHGKWHMLRDDYTKAVTHWMPLPQPPKEE